MSDTIIQVENLGKKYLIKHQQQGSYTSLRDVITDKVKSFGKRIISPWNHKQSSIYSTTEEFWALKDISFKVKQGEVIGVIGPNGAGKSTLLKIISRITEPTKGRIRINGRVASLLEVGTGFHPELTGRENIFLNGAILGMTRAEINGKFDEIVAFAEIEKFLDTPVKRYSSGMYVRLAFAVAAHLEPEILIVDEVLAVGDAQFQKKCLGKMEDVGKGGRTVIYVSHSMPAVTSLCSRAILLESGKAEKMGPTSEVVMHYYTSGQSSPASADFSSKQEGDTFVRLLKGEIKNSKGEVTLEVSVDEPIAVEMTFEIMQRPAFQFVPNFYFYTAEGACAFVAVSDDRELNEKGRYVATCYIPGNLLNEGAYFVALSVSSFGAGVKVHFFERDALSINIVDSLRDTSMRTDWAGVMPGVVRPKLSWKTYEL
jgi:lipopolysaccharide transport system ATP-binding protein